MAKNSKTFILSDESVNSHGFRVLTDGIDTSRFESNPVMLFNHISWGDKYNGPIGRWENIRKENGQLLAESVFDEEDEEAAKIAGKVSRGFIKGASIGILDIVEWSEDPNLMLPGQKLPTVTKCVIYEASVCDFPSNEKSIALVGKDGKITMITEDSLRVLLSANQETKTDVIFKNDMTKLAVFAALLCADADKLKNEDDLLALVTVLKNDLDKANAEVSRLRAAAETQLTSDIKELLDNAEADGRIDKEDKKLRGDFEALGKVNLGLLKTTLTAMKPAETTAPPTGKFPNTLVKESKRNTGGVADEPADRSEWTTIDYQKNDWPAYLKIKEENPHLAAKIAARKPK